jgi:hypothetical protein
MVELCVEDIMIFIGIKKGCSGQSICGVEELEKHTHEYEPNGHIFLF